MNYIKHLTAFFERVAGDHRLNSTHVSVYISLFQFWNINRFQNPISVSRSEVMRVSKISARATYHKVIKELHSFGYIRYKPSHDPYKGSSIYLIEFQSTSEQLLNKSHTKNRTSCEQAVVPYINSINDTNSKQSESAHTGSNFELVQKPSEEELKEFFEQQDSSGVEAAKFFNHFQSNGWLVGGRTPMKDWRAAAKKWMLSTNSSAHIKSSKLPLNNGNKDYSEPL